MEREEFNAEQREKLFDLAFKAAAALDELGDHALGDAILLVETANPDGAQILAFNTTSRVAVQRGIIEHWRDHLMQFTFVNAEDAEDDE